MFEVIHKYPIIGYDVESTGLNYPVDKAFGVGVWAGDQGYYLDLRLHFAEAKRELERYKGRIVCHNAAFDAKMSYAAGINLPLEQLDCTIVRAAQIDEYQDSYELDRLAFMHLDLNKEPIWDKMAEIFGGLATKQVQAKNLKNAPIKLVQEYCTWDAALAYKLWCWQEDEIKRQGIEDIIKFERSVMPSIIRASIRGVRVDVDAADRARKPLTEAIVIEQAKLDELVGKSVNVNSTPQIRAMFPAKKVSAERYELACGTRVEAAKTGPRLNAEALRRIPDQRAGMILRIRSLIKMRDTFLSKHIIEHAIGGRVYPNINQTASDEGGTRTGRLSYSDPALQQISSRDKQMAAIIKPCFLPEEGHSWVSWDLRSFEVRVFAHFVAKFNQRIVDEFQADPLLDFHQFVADLTGLVRNATYAGQPNAKQLNLSMIFCQGRGATAEKMGMEWSWDEFTNDYGQVIRYKKPSQEAIDAIDRYHERVPGVRELAAREKEKALTRGYIWTPFGRRCRFPGGYKAYKASGLLIQATAADINKKNWIAAENALDPVGGHMILNCHDGYEHSVPEDKVEIAMKNFTDIVEDPEWHGLRVPLRLEHKGVGSNWWEAIKKD